jgi:hypothetical protein
MMWIFAFVILFLASANEIAIAQQTPARYPTVIGNNFAPGSVLQYLNPSGQAVPASAANPVPMTCISGCSGGGTLTGVTCGSAASSCVLKPSQGNLFGVYAECSAACWMMVFNSITAPSNGSTTAGVNSGNMVECLAIPAHDQRSVNYPFSPASYTVGITVAISSTECATLTLATTGFIRGTVQ